MRQREIERELAGGCIPKFRRAEQIELSADEGGVAARVVSHDYHGHDVVVHLRPEQADGGRDVIARLAGGNPLPSGAQVSLRARGPVYAWSKDLNAG